MISVYLIHSGWKRFEEKINSQKMCVERKHNTMVEVKYIKIKERKI